MASRSLGTLTLDLVAKVGGFVQGMDKAARESEKRMAQIRKTAKATGVALAALGTGAAAWAVAQTKASIDAADALSKQSKAVGIAVEDLGALNYAAELSGVSIEEVSAGMNRFNRSVGEVIDGTGAGADAFERLGISAKNADGSIKSNIDLIRELSDAFAGMEDGAQKAALVQDLFGRSGTKLIPLLNGGADGLAAMADEAQRLGLIIDSETAAAAEQFNDNLTRLQKSSGALGISIAQDLLPSFIRITEVMVAAQKESGILEAAWVGLGGVLAEGLGLNDSAEEQIRSIEKLLSGDFLDRVRFFGKDGFVEYYSEDELRAELAKLRKIVDEEAARTASPVTGTAPSVPAGPSKEFTKRLADLQRELDLYGEVGKAAQLRYDIENGLIDGLLAGEGQKLIALQQELDARAQTTKFLDEQRKAAEQLQSTYDSQVDQYLREIALTGELTELERLRYEITQGNLVGISSAQQAYIEGLAREKEAVEAVKQAEEDRKALQEDVDSLTRGLMTEQEATLERYIESMNTLNKAQREGITILGGYDEASRRVFEQYQKDLDKAAEDTSQISIAWDEALRGIQGHLADYLFDPFKDGLDGMLDGFIEVIRRMAAEAAAAQIMDSIFGSTTQSGQREGGIDWAGLATTFAGFFDGGGSIGSGQFGIVGENGPELVRGPALVTSRNDTARMMGGGTTNNINISTGARTRQEAQEAGGAIARQVARAVSSGQRYS